MRNEGLRGGLRYLSRRIERVRDGHFSSDGTTGGADQARRDPVEAVLGDGGDVRGEGEAAVT
jgi:hypothetical protein